MEKLTVFYDGACHLCYREVSHYFERDKDDLLQGVDISSIDFNASDYGLIEKEVNLHMHAMDESGKLYVGVDCFVQIWKRLPLYNAFARVLTFKKTRPMIDLAYDIFARKIRPNLPKRQCDDGSCELKS